MKAVILLLLITNGVLLGQNEVFKANFLLGKVVKHTEKLSYDPKGIAKGIEFSYEKKMDTHRWSSYFGDPSFGVKLSLLDFGDAEILGYGIGLFPYYRGKFYHSFHYMIGTGVGYVTKTYISIDNELNNYVSSNLNNITSIELGYTHKINPKWEWNLNMGIRHFSNGGSKLPNFGINFVNINAGITYSFITDLSSDVFNNDTLPKVKKIGVEYYYHLSRNESITFGGPKYPVYIQSFGINWNHNPFSTTKLNIDFERHKWVEAFGLSNGKYKTLEEAKSKSGRFAISLGQEYFFDNISILAHLGFYFNNEAEFVPNSFFEKLGIRYYFVNKAELPIKVHGGLYMKAHKATAEYISAGLGVVFR